MSHPKLQKKKKILSSMLRTFRAKGTLLILKFFLFKLELKFYFLNCQMSQLFYGIFKILSIFESFGRIFFLEKKTKIISNGT